MELKASLSSQEEVNRQLQKYIDAVILNIMEKNPELLEVSKRNWILSYLSSVMVLRYQLMAVNQTMVKLYNLPNTIVYFISNVLCNVRYGIHILFWIF